MAVKHPATSRAVPAMSTTPRQAPAMAPLRMGDDYHNRDARGILPLAEEAFDHATFPCRALARFVRGSHDAHRRGTDAAAGRRPGAEHAGARPRSGAAAARAPRLAVGGDVPDLALGAGA